MTLQQLQYIVALDTHRHFVKAAESCFVAQPTLTLQVKKLEEQINLVIFDRDKTPLEPTPLGEVFIQKARQILREIDQLKQFVEDDRNQIEGNFRLGVIPTLSQYLLPLFINEFSESHPNTKLELKEWQSDAIIEGLKVGTLDMGLLATPLVEPTLREIPLFYEPFLLYANVNNDILEKKKINSKELSDEGVWLLNQGHCFRNQMLNICSKSNVVDERKITFESGSIETIKRMVEKNFGYTLIPELAYNENNDKKVTRRFSSPEPAREISLVTHNSFTKELLITHLRKAILKNIPNSFQKNERFITVKWR